MKRIILFINLIVSSGLFSQPAVRFIKFYDLPPHYGSYSYDVTTTHFGYILSGITVDTANGYSYNKLTLLALDSLGDSLWTKSYGNPGFQYTHDYSTKWMLKRGNSLFLACPVIKPGDSVHDVLIKFNMNGDTVWQKEYSAIQQGIVFEGFNPTPDGGFVFTGYIAGGSTEALFLMKTDSLGNELWRKEINTNTFEIEGSSVVYDSNDKKYIIVGINGPPPSYDTRSIVIITDSLGNKLNQFSYSNTYGGALNHLIQTYDNNFVACGDISTGTMIGSFEEMRALLVKFDINGTIIWSKQYGIPSIINNLSILKELPDRSIVLGGEYDTVYTQGLGLNSSFKIQKTNQNGDSLWMRTIDLVRTNANQDRFNSMDITNDGGFVLTGFFVNPPPPNKYVLVKLDNLGCDSLGCQFMGIQEQKSTEQVSVYPNPTNSTVTISLSNSLKQIKQINIYDVIGKEIKQVNNPNKSSNIQLNLATFGKGIFLLKIMLEDDSFSTKKVVTY